MQPDTPPAPAHEKLSALLIGLILVTSLPELLLSAADRGLVGSANWRPLAYQYGAFWVGLLHDWRPNYIGQPVAMFVTYAFLHGGFAHLAGNMLALVGLGTATLRRTGSGRFAIIYLVSAVGGGLGFGLLSTSVQPMVGASGALFGLAGALTCWEWLDRRATRQPLRPVFYTIAAYMALNLVLWALLAGQLAWETHLGGFIAGGAAVALLERRKRPGEEPGRF